MSTDIATRIVGNNEARRERLRRLKRSWHQLRANTTAMLGLVMILVIAFSALFAPVVAPYPQDAGDALHFGQTMEPPSVEHPMGTDKVGRDILSRVIFGARISLQMGATVLLLAVPIGVSLGLIAGYLGGWVNGIIMRTTDMFLAIPPTVFALAVVAAINPSITNAMIAISVTWWPWYTRLVQGEVLSIKEEGFIEASESIGSSWLRITFREILPNAIAPITVKATIDFGFVVLVGASLGFLGLGAQPPTPEWGLMITRGRAEITTAWWMATFPGLAISFTVLAFNLLGDGLRDLLDVEEVNNF